MIALYYCRIPETEDAVPLPELTVYRRQRLAGTRSRQARLQGLGAEWMLYYALRRHAPQLPWPPELMTGEQGKPMLRDAGVHFSLSHSDIWAACAVSSRELGLDIQQIRMPRESVLERCFTEEERAYIAQSENAAEAFTRLWCRKESRLKAQGLGLFTAPALCSTWERPWEFAEGRAEDFCYALCVPGATALSCSVHRVELEER